MPKLNRRDFLKLAGVSAPVVGLSAYQLTRQGNGDGTAIDIGTQTANAAALPKNAVSFQHPNFRGPFVRTRPFPGMRIKTNRGPAGAPPFDLLENQPQRIESQNGVLEFELRAEYANPVVNGIPLNMRTYNGTIPGPTLVARPGDVLKIRHPNNFPPREDDFIKPEDENIPHGFNNINLHTHGMNVSPVGNEDNVLHTIHPGEVFDFEIRIPEDHPTGTFWYHPHKHGSALHQLASGMAGYLLIVGPGDLSDIPEIAAAQEVEIAFEELIIDQNGEVPDVPIPTSSLFKFEAFLQLTVNGLAVNEGADPETGEGSVPPVIHMRPGEVQRWRFGLLAHLQTYRFALEGHQLYVAAWDGITDDELTVHDELILGPANRVDLLIKASDTPGTYAFKMLEEQFGEFPLFVTPSPLQAELPVFNVIVEGDPMPMSLPTTLNPPRARLPYIEESEIVRRRQIDFSVTGDVTFDFDTFTFISDTRQFFVNERKFSSSRVDQTMVLGTAEEWLITNAPQINHPFHIHVNWFQLMELRHADGTVETFNNGLGRWLDTIDVPFGGSALIRHRFQKFPGLFVFHCHVIAHEDEGMMQVIEVADATPVIAPITTAAGGVIVSSDVTNRVTARFFPNAVSADTEVTYAYHLDPQQPLGDLIGLERYFDLTSPQMELDIAALIEVKFPLELASGLEYDPNTVHLYRFNGSEWSAEGINVIGLNKGGILVSSVKTLGQFAVLASPPMV